MNRSAPIKVGILSSALLLIASTNPAFAEHSEPGDLDFVASQEAGRLVPTETVRGADGPGEVFVSFTVDSKSAIKAKEVKYSPKIPTKSTDGRTARGGYTISSEGRVDVTWWDPSNGSIEWSVYRDGALIETTHGNKFSEAAPRPAKKSRYTITGTRVVHVDGNPQTEPFVTSLDVPSVDTTPLGMDSADPRVTDAASNSDVLPDSVRVPEFNMTTQLNTFIPSEKAEVPVQPCEEAKDGGYYGGDNRTFAGPDVVRPSSRTGIERIELFRNAALQTREYKYWTSGTHLYNKDGSLRQAKDPDLSGIKITGEAGDIPGGITAFRHHVADPLCSIAPAIDYEMTIGSYANGHVSLVGSHDQAPSYEWRVKTKNGFENLWQFNNRGLPWLAPPFPQGHVDLSYEVDTI